MDKSDSKSSEHLVFHLPSQLRYSVSSCTPSPSLPKQADHRASPAHRVQLRKTVSDGITAKFGSTVSDSGERACRTLLLYSGFSVPEGATYGGKMLKNMEAGDTLSKTSLHKQAYASSHEGSRDERRKERKRKEKQRQRLEEREVSARRERKLERENAQMEERLAQLHWQLLERDQVKKELEERATTLEKKHAALVVQRKNMGEVSTGAN